MARPRWQQSWAGARDTPSSYPREFGGDGRTEFGHRPLVWEEVPERRRFRIAAKTKQGGVIERGLWRRTWDDLLADLIALEQALRPYLKVAKLTDSWVPTSAAKPSGWDLAPGELIRRTELHDRFGGNRQGGIGSSAQSPNVFVFSDPRSGEQFGYHDRWDGPVFHYTGEGQVGDQKMIGGNKAILEHAETGRALRTFKGVGGLVRYEGEFALESDRTWYYGEARDRNGDLRKVIVFRMRSIDGTTPVTVTAPPDKPPATAALRPTSFGGTYQPADERPASQPREPFSVDPNVIDRGTRGHAKTQNALAAFLAAHGVAPLRPINPDPDFDVGWRKGGAWYVVEVKSLTAANEARQLRLALGQVLDYHDALARRHDDVRAVIAVERRPADPRWVSLCERHDVLLVWPETFDAVLSPILSS
jgi:hypothetical protein